MVIQHNYLGEIEELLPKKSVSRLLSNCQPTVSRQLVANSQLTNGNCWSTKDQQSADGFPHFFAGDDQQQNKLMANKFWGKLFSILPLFRLFIGSYQIGSHFLKKKYMYPYIKNQDFTQILSEIPINTRVFIGISLKICIKS